MINKQKIKYSAFTLIEVLVSLSLFFLICTSLFGLIWQNTYTTKRLLSMKEEADELRDGYARLQNIFSNLPHTHSADSPQFFFSQKGTSSQVKNTNLIFTFNNGIDADSDFTSTILAKLYLDTDQNLILAVWPDPVTSQSTKNNTIPMRKEIILKNIDSMDLQFWSAPPKKTIVQGSKSKEPQYGIWLDEWSDEYEKAPTLIKMTITPTSDGPAPAKDYTFVFVVPHELPIIEY